PPAPPLYGGGDLRRVVAIERSTRSGRPAITEWRRHTASEITPKGGIAHYVIQPGVGTSRWPLVDTTRGHPRRPPRPPVGPTRWPLTTISALCWSSETLSDGPHSSAPLRSA